MPPAADIAWKKLQEIGYGAFDLAPNLLIAIIVFVGFAVVARLLSAGTIGLAVRTGQSRNLAIVFSRIVRGAIHVLGALVAATIIFPSLDAASIFGALGVGGVAVGFAFKDIFQNLLAGMLILVTKPFKIGDQIVTGSHEGTVDDIQIRATLLRTYDNRIVVVPNSELYTNRVIVNTAFSSRRVSVPVSIGYGDDIDEAAAVIRKALTGLDRVAREPEPSVLVRGFGESSVDLEVRFWISPTIRREAVLAVDEALRAMKPALVKAGIDLPFPTRLVLFHDQTEDVDGDRRRQREGWPSRGDDPRPREFHRAKARALAAEAPANSG